MSMTGETIRSMPGGEDSMPENERRLRAASAVRASTVAVVMQLHGGAYQTGPAQLRDRMNRDMARFGALLKLANVTGENRTAKVLLEQLGGGWSNFASSEQFDVAAEAYVQAMEDGLGPEGLRASINDRTNTRYERYGLVDLEARKGSRIDDVLTIYEDRWNQELGQDIINPPDPTHN